MTNAPASLCLIAAMLAAATTYAGSTIIGGSVAAGDPSVVMLVSYPSNQETFETCTATIVAPRVLLTAAHCVDAEALPNRTFGVFLGNDATAFPSIEDLAPHLVPVVETRIHDPYDRDPPYKGDIAVVLVEEDLPAPPIVVNRAPLNTDWVGTKVRIVGFGQTTYGEYNAEKHAAETTIEAIQGDTILVGDPKHLSCIGDSGGPALAVLDGIETIVGVDSYADLAGCLEPAHYRRTDAYVEFLAPYLPDVPVMGAGGSGVGGSTVSEEGGRASECGEAGGGCPPASTRGAAPSDTSSCSVSRSCVGVVSDPALSWLLAATLWRFLRAHAHRKKNAKG